MENDALLTTLLREVSRSFYLTLRVLPAAVRSQIGLAYLLARTTDTIADTEMVALPKRLQALNRFRARVLGNENEALNFGELAQNQSLPAEKILLERVEDALNVLARFSPEDQERIRQVLAIIIGGQELDVQRFAGAGAEKIVALAKDDDLDDYTYRVAGCVGEFWTRMCRAHLFPKANLDDPLFESNGVRFGKGLQLVNILRDLPRDLRQGRCYLPQDKLASAGLSPLDLLAPANEPRLRPVYDFYLARAESHLRAGWDYTNSLPASQIRIRLACAWPVLIGARTLAKLRRENVLDPNLRIKVGRAEIYAIMGRSVICLPFSRAWRGQLAPAKTG